jgi:hypothetical protein
MEFVVARELAVQLYLHIPTTEKFLMCLIIFVKSFAVLRDANVYFVTSDQ